MKNRFVVLPNLTGKIKTKYILCDRNCVISDVNIQFNIVKVFPGELLCCKWSYDLLEKYGETHVLDSYDLCYILSYIINISSEKFCCFQNYIDYVSIKDVKLEEFLNNNQYNFVIPAIHLGVKVSSNYCKRHSYFTLKNSDDRKAFLGHFWGQVCYGAKSKLIHYLCNFINNIHYIYISCFKSDAIFIELNDHCISNIVKQNIKTSGGAHFYSGINEKGEKKFIKAYDINNVCQLENQFYENYRSAIKDFSVSKDIGYEKSNICVYEFCEAPTLSSVLQERNLTKKEYILLEKFLESLIIFLEENNITYGDLRPDNILLVHSTEDEIAFKICDWGWAKSNNIILNNKSFLYNRFYSRIGDEFRFSKYVISDIASAYSILNKCNGDIIINSFFSNKISVLLKEYIYGELF